MKFLLLLCQPDDAAAYRLAAFCRLHDLPTRVVTGPELAAAPVWHVQTGTAGTTWYIGLPDGTLLCPDTVAGVYCRLLALPCPSPFAAPEDAEYGATELQALVTGWLRNAEVPLLSPVPPTLLAHAPANGWLQLAQLAAAGLPVPATACLTAPQRWAGLPEIPFSAAHPQWLSRTGTWLQEPLLPVQATALVVGDAVLDAPAPELQASLLQLRKVLGASVFAVPFTRAADGSWRALGYHFLPDWGTAAAAEAFVAFAWQQLPQDVAVPHLLPLS